MNLILRRIVLCLLTTVYIIRASCQGFSTDPDSTTYESKKLTSIHSANHYIEATILNKQLAGRFIVDSNNSLIICEDYKTFFSSITVRCLPFGYHIKFLILLENKNVWDTVNANLFLSLDSSYAKSHDTLQDMWSDKLLLAWEKVISNKFKINYSEILEFIKRKKLQDYYIDFGYEDYSYNGKDKIYWYVISADEKNNEQTLLYRINPKTGKVKVKKLKPIPYIPITDSH